MGIRLYAFRRVEKPNVYEARREANAEDIDEPDANTVDSGSSESEADRVTQAIEFIRNSPFASVLTSTEAFVAEELESVNHEQCRGSRNIQANNERI